MSGEAEIVVVGAGAAGLMCAYEVAKRGKKVVILEARGRIGGRIWQAEDDFGFPVQAGAEFIHGEAPVTKALADEAGLTIISLDTEIWHPRPGGFVVDEGIALFQAALNEKFQQLKEDVPIATFLETYFGGEEYRILRDYVITMVEGYDAADVRRMSTFSLRNEWLGGQEWQQARIQEGYGALLHFLESRLRELGVEIQLRQVVEQVELHEDAVTVRCRGGKTYRAQQVVVTVPVSTLPDIQFEPALPEKMNAASRVGSGGVIKALLLFDERWWAHATASGKMVFIVAHETIPVWWEQYSDRPLLVGWVAGPKAEKVKYLPDDEIVDLALTSLANIFGVAQDALRGKLLKARVANWLADPFARGAYSYPTPETKGALDELARPVGKRLFFAGEALYSGQETATVEGALASGRETAQRMV